MKIAERLNELGNEYKNIEREIYQLFKNKIISKNLRDYLINFSQLSSFGKIAIAFAEEGIGYDAFEALEFSKEKLGGVSVSLLGVIGTEAEVNECNFTYYTGPRMADSLSKIGPMKPLFNWAERTYKEYEEKVFDIFKKQNEVAQSN